MDSHELTKEEKEKLIDEKMANMRKVNALLEQRHKEIEDDKRQAIQHSSAVQMQEVKRYVMKPTHQKSDKPKTPVLKEAGETRPTPYFSQKILEGPPPDPANRFLFDPDRDTGKFPENSGRGKSCGRGSDNNRGSNRAKYRGAKQSVFQSEKTDSIRNGTSFATGRDSCSPRANYRGHGRRINYNWNMPNLPYGNKRGSSSYQHIGWRQLDTTHADRVPGEQESWKIQQDACDERRIARARKSDGRWRREWDSHKDIDFLKVAADAQSGEKNPFAQFLISKTPMKEAIPIPETVSIEAQSSQVTSPENYISPLESHFNRRDIDGKPKKITKNENILEYIIMQDTMATGVLSSSDTTASNTSNDTPSSSMNDKISHDDTPPIPVNNNSMTSASISDNYPALPECPLRNVDLTCSSYSNTNDVFKDSGASYEHNIVDIDPVVVCIENVSDELPSNRENDTYNIMSIDTATAVTDNDTTSDFEPSTLPKHGVEDTLPNLSGLTLKQLVVSSNEEDKLLASCSTTDIADNTASLNGSADLHFVGDARPSFSLKGAAGLDNTSSESSIYEAVDEDFPSSCDTTASTSDNSFMTSTDVPIKASIGSALIKTEESSEGAPETCIQLDLPINDSPLEIGSANESD